LTSFGSEWEQSARSDPAWHRTQIRRTGDAVAFVNSRATEWLTTRWFPVVTRPGSCPEARIPSRAPEDDTRRRSVSSRTNAVLASRNRSHVSPRATLAVAGTAWCWHASVAAAPVPGLSHHIVQKNAEVGLPASTSTIESTVTRNTGLLCSSSGKEEANEVLREF
jgi:hypothetical protein